MTVEIAKAIKDRWDAKSLGDTITGGIHSGRVPPGFTMPYAVWSEMSSSVVLRTRRTRHTNLIIQWDVFVDNDNPETAADLLQSILDVMVHGQDASADALDPAGVNIIDSEITSDIHTEEDGPDKVFRATATQRFRVTRKINRTPA